MSTSVAVHEAYPKLLTALTDLLVLNFNKHIPNPGLKVRNEVVHMGDLHCNSSRTPSLVTQILGKGGLIEFIQQPYFVFGPGKEDYKHGIVPAAPVDNISFTAVPQIMFWDPGGTYVLEIRNSNLGPYLDMDLDDFFEKPDFCPKVGKSVSDFVNELIEAALGEQTRFNYKGSHGHFIEHYKPSLGLGQNLTTRVISAFNEFLPAKGIEAESHVMGYFDYPESGMPRFETKLIGEKGTILIWQEYVALPTGVLSNYKDEKAGMVLPLSPKLDSLQVTTYPFIIFRQPDDERGGPIIAPHWKNPSRMDFGKFKGYQNMAEQLLTMAIGSKPQPAEVQLKMM